jgi:hypothetical protein
VQIKLTATRFLNFEGEQRTRFQGEATSSARSANFRAGDNRRQQDEDQEGVGDHANPILHEQEELMKGVEDIVVDAPDKGGGLLPVYGSDGLQQRVSLGTHMGSEGDSSVDDTPHHGVETSLMVHGMRADKKVLKIAGLCRSNNDKMKR